MVTSAWWPTQLAAKTRSMPWGETWYSYGTPSPALQIKMWILSVLLLILSAAARTSLRSLKSQPTNSARGLSLVMNDVTLRRQSSCAVRNLSLFLAITNTFWAPLRRSTSVISGRSSLIHLQWHMTKKSWLTLANPRLAALAWMSVYEVTLRIIRRTVITAIWPFKLGVSRKAKFRYVKIPVMSKESLESSSITVGCAVDRACSPSEVSQD